MDKYEKERNVFNSFLKLFQTYKLPSEKWMHELDKASLILQKCASNGKFEILKKINNTEVIKYISQDIYKAQFLNAYFQKRLQVLKNNSGAYLSNLEEKALKFDLMKLLEKYNENDRITIITKLINILIKFNNDNDNTSISSIINDNELKENAKLIFKYVDKNRKLLDQIIKFFQRQSIEVKSKLSYCSIFSQVIDNKNIDTFEKFLEYRESLTKLKSESRGPINLPKNVVQAHKNLLNCKNIPILLSYVEFLSNSNPNNVSVKATSIEELVYMVIFDFENDRADVFIKDGNIELSFAKINKLIDNSDNYYQSKLIDLGNEEFIKEYNEGEEKNRNKESCDKIVFYLDMDKIVDCIKCNINKNYPGMNINIHKEKDFRKLSSVIKTHYENIKDSIILTNDKNKMMALINNIKVLSLNLQLNYEDNKDLSKLSEYKKTYSKCRGLL